MHLIFYTSQTTLPHDQIEANLADIVRACNLHNKENGITGVLFYENRNFIQALEGEEDAVRGTLKRVQKDPRHTNLKVLVDKPIEERSFSDWAMDTFFVKHPDLVDGEMISLIQKIYDRSLPVNTKDLVEFHKRMIDEVDTFKILRIETEDET